MYTLNTPGPTPINQFDRDEKALQGTEHTPRSIKTQKTEGKKGPFVWQSFKSWDDDMDDVRRVLALLHAKQNNQQATSIQHEGGRGGGAAAGACEKPGAQLGSRPAKFQPRRRLVMRRGGEGRRNARNTTRISGMGAREPRGYIHLGLSVTLVLTPLVGESSQVALRDPLLFMQLAAMRVARVGLCVCVCEFGKAQ